MFPDIISLAKGLRLRVLIDGLDECDSESTEGLTSKLAGIDGQESYRTLRVTILSRYISNLEGIKCLVLDPDHDQLEYYLWKPPPPKHMTQDAKLLAYFRKLMRKNCISDVARRRSLVGQMLTQDL